MRTTSLVAIFLLLLSVIFAKADVNVSLPDTTAYPGDTLKVPIHVSDLTGLGIYAYQFKIKYDATVIKAIGIDSTGTITQRWGPPGVNLKIAGEIVAGNYDVNPLQNSGVLIYIKFQIIGLINNSTPLTCAQFEFNAGKPAVKTKNGSLKILPPLMTVSFKTNVTVKIRILIDGITRILPFDTTWTYGDSHKIGTISPQYQTTDSRYTFFCWSDMGDTVHSVVTTSDTTFVLNMNLEFRLTLASKYGTARGEGWYVNGTTATFAVDSLAQEGDSIRHVFQSWSGAGNNSYTGPQRIISIVMKNPVTETANWGLQYFLKINSIYGTPIGQGWHNPGDTITISIDSLVSPVAGTRYLFDSWSGKGKGSYSGTKHKTKVIVLAPIVEQASWRTDHYLWVRSKPQDIAQFKNSGWYKKNKPAYTDTAQKYLRTTNYFYHFQNWSIDGKLNSQNPAPVLMDTSHTAEAIYKIDSVLVTITSNIGLGTLIYVDDIRYPVPYSKFWAFQSEHKVEVLQVQPGSHQMIRYSFKSWSDNGARDHTVKPDSAIQLTVFLATEFFLSIDTYPTGLISLTEIGWYGQGDTVHLPQAPAQIIAGQDTFHFKGWYMDNRPVTGNPILVIMDRYHTVIASYKDLYFIKGQIKSRRGNPIPGLRIILSGAFNDTCNISDDNKYSFNFLKEGNYQVIPDREGFRFEPPSREYKPLQINQSDQDFTAIDTVKPKINLICPNGGEKLKSVTSDTIIWQAEDNWGIDSIWIDLTTNNGTSWQNIAMLQSKTGTNYIWTIPDTTSSACKIRMVAIDFGGNRAFDVSDSTFTITSISEIPYDLTDNRPIKFKVHQNYPNPFNSITIIPFQIPESCQVTVRIFNVMGQEIVTLVRQKLDTGYHKTSWNGKDQYGRLVRSGIYFYQVETLHEKSMLKLLYVR